MTEHLIRTLIVDDEPLGREIIGAMLADEPEIEIVAECENGRQAIAAINRLQPELLFLDVQMPGIDGFGVLQAIEKAQLPYIIFVTAYDQYAVKAFEYHALDYVLKPIDPDRFANAVRRAVTAIQTRHDSIISRNILALLNGRNEPLRSAPQQQSYLERLAIKKDGKIYFLRTTEIEWIVAEGNYVSLHAGKRSHLLRMTIGALEIKLAPNKFQRINRSTLVNLDFIKELIPMLRGEHQVVMQDGTTLKLSARFRDNLAQALGDTF